MFLCKRKVTRLPNSEDYFESNKEKKERRVSERKREKHPHKILILNYYVRKAQDN